MFLRLDELGQIDVPATIDYILNITRHSSIFYVGYSQGTTSLMITLSALPDYNSKIKTAILLAPIVYMKHFPNRFFHGKFFYSAIQVRIHCFFLLNHFNLIFKDI